METSTLICAFIIAVGAGVTHVSITSRSKLSVGSVVLLPNRVFSLYDFQQYPLFSNGFRAILVMAAEWFAIGSLAIAATFVVDSFVDIIPNFSKEEVFGIVVIGSVTVGHALAGLYIFLFLAFEFVNYISSNNAKLFHRNLSGASSSGNIHGRSLASISARGDTMERANAIATLLAEEEDRLRWQAKAVVKLDQVLKNVPRDHEGRLREIDHTISHLKAYNTHK